MRRPTRLHVDLRVRRREMRHRLVLRHPGRAIIATLLGGALLSCCSSSNGTDASPTAQAGAGAGGTSTEGQSAAGGGVAAGGTPGSGGAAGSAGLTGGGSGGAAGSDIGTWADSPGECPS